MTRKSGFWRIVGFPAIVEIVMISSVNWQWDENGVLMSLLLVLITSRAYSQTLLRIEPPGNGDIVTREGSVIKMACFYDANACGTFFIQYGDSEANFLRLWQNTTIPSLNAVAVPHIINNTVTFQLEFIGNRSHINNTVTCGLEQITGDSTDAILLNIEYPPSPKFSTTNVSCVDARDTHPAPVVLVFTDNASNLGNPVSTVSWGNNSGIISGMYNQQLSLNVTRNHNEYDVIATAHNTVGSSAKKFILCVKSNPSPPTQLMCRRIVVGYDCSWGHPDDDGGYPLNHYIFGYFATGSNTEHFAVQVSYAAAQNRTLKENTNYTISVVAVNAVGDSKTTTTSILTPKRPDKPEIPEASEVSTSSVNVSWNPPPNPDPDPQFAVLEYRVGLHIKKQFTWEESLRTVTTSSLSQTFFGLNASTTYWIRVGARNSVGWSDLSTAVSFLTKDLSNAGQPAIESVRSTNCSSISLNWTEASPGGRSYRVLDYLVVVYEAGREYARKNVTGIGTTFDGLANNTDYEMEVTARNRKGYGQPSPLTNVTTLMCPPDNSSTGFSDGLIAAIAVGVGGAVLVLVVCVLGVICYLRCD
jgi:chitodextrinase